MSKHKEMRTRLRWTFSYKSLYFVHPSLKLLPLFTGMQERSLSFFFNTMNAILLSDRQPYTLLTIFFRYSAALRLDRKSILLGLLPSPCLRCASSRVPLLCAYFSPGDGRGHQSIVQCGTADERRNGNYRADHLDVRLVLLGYNIPNNVPL